MSAEKYNFDDAINAFFVESREMLEDMENSLLDLEKDLANLDYIPAIFRAAHSIKGSAGMFGFNDIGDFTHVVENILDNVRNNELIIDPDLVALLLDCHDYILKLVELFDRDRKAEIDGGLKSESNNLLNQLNIYLLTEKAGDNIDGAEKKETLDETDITENSVQVLNECWHISLRFGKDVFRHGLDPQSFIKYLGEMGKIENIKTIYESIPAYKEVDTEDCYLGFEISFMGFTTKEKIEEVFEFVQDDCKVRILHPKSELNEYVRLIEDLPEESMYLGEILNEIGSLTENELGEALKLQDKLASNDKKKIGEIVVEEKMVHKPVLDAAVEKQSRGRKAEEKSKKSMRIDTIKLDILINLVGELVISSSNILQIAKKSGNSELIESFLQMSRLVDNIRDNSMNIRMVQIGESFKRFERIVRDISREKGKDVELILNGGETELDKTIIEKVSDPLMHLVRNAVDHGVDLPEERVAKGKRARGTITLNAFHETGNIVIEIMDDGNGLNREKILGKAIEKGLIEAHLADSVSDNDLFQFIFAPGFSTADKVTEISGRGVGMDVVKKNVESLRGSVVIQSKEGKGTSVKIILPLTLAIIDGFLVKVGDIFCVFPLDMVVECLNITHEDLKRNESGNFFELRGDIVPFLRLREFLGEIGEAPEKENIIVVEYAQKKVGIVVEKSFGEFQTVVKPLGRIFNKIEWVSGATILGGGDVGLILDVPILIQYTRAMGEKKAS